MTPDDVKAQRQLRESVPSWLMMDWRELDALVAPDALDRRPLAQDSWTPFSLD